MPVALTQNDENIDRIQALLAKESLPDVLRAVANLCGERAVDEEVGAGRTTERAHRLFALNARLHRNASALAPTDDGPDDFVLTLEPAR